MDTMAQPSQHLKHGDNGDDLLGAAHLSGGEEHLAEGGMDGLQKLPKLID